MMGLKHGVTKTATISLAIMTVLVAVIIGTLFVSAQPTNTVNIGSTSFSPQQLTVAIGSTVTWTNTDLNSVHRIISNNLFDSGNIQPRGGTFSYIFNNPGSFQYHDFNNPGITGTINVA